MDDAFEEEVRQLREASGRQLARVDAGLAAQGTDIRVLEAQVAGLSAQLDVATRRIDQIEAACFRRLDRHGAMMDPLRSPSTGTTVA